MGNTGNRGDRETGTEAGGGDGGGKLLEAEGEGGIKANGLIVLQGAIWECCD